MQTITLNNKDYPFVFKLIAMEQFELATGKKIQDSFDDISFTDISQLAICGLREGAVRAGEEFDLDSEKVSIAIGDDPQLFKQVMDLIKHDMEQFMKSFNAKKKIVKRP